MQNINLEPFFDCDVIVVNYNAGSLLMDCVSSAFSEGANHVIVVDNCSKDNSLNDLERMIQNDKLIIIRNQKNLGFAAGCNIGVEASTASHLLFLNPDGILGEKSLCRMIDVLDSSDSVGMVGGFLCNLDGTEQAGGRRLSPTPRRAFMKAFGFSYLARFFPHFFSDVGLHTKTLPTEPIVVEAISGACMLVKRKAIDDVGLWDENYFLYCEDDDWCMRFNQKGWAIKFVPDAKVTHARRACSRKRPFFVEWHKHRGMLRFYDKFFREQYSGFFWMFVFLGVWFRFTLVVLYYAFQLSYSKLISFSKKILKIGK